MTPQGEAEMEVAARAPEALEGVVLRRQGRPPAMPEGLLDKRQGMHEDEAGEARRWMSSQEQSHPKSMEQFNFLCGTVHLPGFMVTFNILTLEC